MSTNADKVISTNARRWIVCEGCPYPLTCEAQGCIYPSDAVVTIAEPKSIINSPFSPDGVTMADALEADARKLEAMGADAGLTFDNGLHTDGPTFEEEAWGRVR